LRKKEERTLHGLWKHDFDSITKELLHQVEEKLNNRLSKKIKFFIPKTK